MKSLMFVTGVTLLSIACGAKGAGLATEAAAVVSADDESTTTENSVEQGLEVPLSGATLAGETGALGTVDTTSSTNAAANVTLNAGTWFVPIGCIVNTQSLNVITSTFTDCTGPSGLMHFTGTVTSTWTPITGGVQVVLATTGFALNGATVDHTATIQYTVVNGTYTLTRKAVTTGTTAKGKAISANANYVTTYDPTTNCATRNGSAQLTLGLVNFSRSIAGYERCNIGLLGCPKSGTFTLTTSRLSLVVDFLGGNQMDVTYNGKKYDNLTIGWCVP